MPTAATAATAATGATRRDIPALTGLRCVAAGWVLLHHASFLPGTGYGAWLAPLRPLVAAGTLGVDLFFVLSGLVLARSYLERWQGTPDRRAAAAYLGGRLARVWPLYALVTVVFGLWCTARGAFGEDGVVAWQYDQPGLDPVSWISQLTMTQLWTAPDIEGISFVLPTWSVSAEWLAYLVLPLVAGLLWRLRLCPRPTLAGLAMLAATPAAVAGVAGATDGLWLARIAGGFTAGVLTWLVVRRTTVTPTVSRRAHAVVVLVLLELLVVVYWAATAPRGADVPADVRLLLAVPLFPVLLGALTLTDRGVARWLAHPWAQHGGRISYALYLVHFPLMEVALVAMTRFDAIAPGTAAAGLLVPHLLVAAVVLAHAAHRLVEEPARRALQARLPRQHRSGAGTEDPSRQQGSACRDEREPRRADVRRAVGRRAGRRAARPVPSTTPTRPVPVGVLAT